MKIGMCGSFAKGITTSCGQIVKTNMVYSCLSELSGAEEILTIDSFYWKNNFFKLVFQCFNLVRNCEHIILLPAENGLRVFVPLFLVLNRIYKKRIHIIAVGGWLPDFISTRKKLAKQLSEINSIHVQSRMMIEKLKIFGLNNVFYMPNTKKIEPLKATEITNSLSDTLSLCTFSRVMKEKGIDIAVKSVYEANKKIGKAAYKIDIYGMIEDKYKTEFEELLKKYESCAVYKGIVSPDKLVETLKDYSLLMFLTYYKGEGFAGTLLDSMASGLPVLASDWKYNSEIITYGYNGFLCETNNMASVIDKLVYIYENQDILMKMRLNCLEQYKYYDYKNVIPKFLEIITR